jgi:archaellum component FlaG (FlaF/FlaG flagellin family)
MADGGASTMIILVASLIVSGLASVVLIDAWGEVADASGKISSSRLADIETDFAFSGDRAIVPLDTSGANQVITLFFQNTGDRTLDKTAIAIFVDGAAVGSGSGSTLHPASGDWAPGSVLEVDVDDPSFAYSDGDRITVTMIAQSEVREGVKGTASESVEVRLSV